MKLNKGINAFPLLLLLGLGCRPLTEAAGNPSVPEPELKKTTIIWQKNPEPDIYYYVVYEGDEPGKYFKSYVIYDTTFIIREPIKYKFYAVTAVDSALNESEFSNEIKLPN